jgi:hypothetical protein
MAIEELEEMIELDPDFVGGHLYISLPYILVGREREGVESYRSWVAFTDTTGSAEFVRAAYASGGIDAFWAAAIDEAKRLGLGPAFVGYYYAFTGNADSAIVYLEQALEQKAFPIHVVAVSQWCKPIYGDPRFQDLLKRAGLSHVKPAFDIP